ncbi:26597_t:CDS:1, partial [Racocetra persica]
CINTTPVSRKKSSTKFWSKALDSTANRKILKNFYENNIIQFDKNISVPAPNLQPNLQDKIFWDGFRDALLSNKRRPDSKI